MKSARFLFVNLMNEFKEQRNTRYLSAQADGCLHDCWFVYRSLTGCSAGRSAYRPAGLLCCSAIGRRPEIEKNEKVNKEPKICKRKKSGESNDNRQLPTMLPLFENRSAVSDSIFNASVDKNGLHSSCNLPYMN